MNIRKEHKFEIKWKNYGVRSYILFTLSFLKITAFDYLLKELDPKKCA